MSKLKEMKREPKEKQGFDFTYVILGVVALFVLMIAFFYLFGDTAPHPVVGVNLEDDDPFKGPSEAKVTIIEFSDFQCPACGSMYHVLKQVFSEYGERIKFVYRDFPLSNIHPFAQKAAEAAQCAFKQGKFWEYHDTLFENQLALKTTDLKQYAADLGLNQSEFDKCLDEGEFSSEVSKDFADAQKLGLLGTPTFFINNVQYSGMSFAQFKTIIDKELAKQ